MKTPDTSAPLEVLQLAVKLCRNQSEFARRIGRSNQVVWAWINRDKQAPIDACPFIEDAIKDPRVTCETLRPDYEGWSLVRSGGAKSADHVAA